MPKLCKEAMQFKFQSAIVQVSVDFPLIFLGHSKQLDITIFYNLANLV